MTDGYIPSCLSDEGAPTREHPNDWVLARNGKLYIDESDNYEHDRDSRRELVEGEAYGFMRLEDFGDAVLTIEKDGSFQFAPEMPTGAEQVMVEFEPDTLSGNVRELVETCDLGEGEYDLSYFTWNDEVWTFAGGKFTRGAP